MEFIFKKFRDKFYNILNNCEHPFSEDSKYHMEGNIWTHTMLVFNSTRLNNSSKIFQISALLHDIGKPLAKFEKEDRIFFTGHENLSVLLSIDYLVDLYENNEINDYELLSILYLINYHGALWQKSEKQIRTYFCNDLYYMVKEFSIHDKNGNLLSELKSKKEVEFDDILMDNFPEYDENKPTCILMIGIPNSGKSSYVFEKGYKKLSRDDILLKYGKEKFNLKTYSEIWNALSDNEQKEIDKLLQKQFGEYVKNKDDFVIDMTNTSIKSRRKWISNLKNKYNIKAKVFLTDFEEIKKRNKKRFEIEGKNIPEKVLIDMGKRLELPLFKEGFCEINIILNNKYEIKKRKI